MADKFLSIQETSLRSVAQAIRDKSNTNANLSFPDGFVSALQNIETEKTVSPKISAAQTVLTPSKTSYTIEPGFHDGTGTVSIQTVSPAPVITPGSTQQSVSATATKFLPSVTVNALPSNAGYTVHTGTWTVSSATTLSLSVNMRTPIGCLLMLQGMPSSTDVHKVSSLSSFGSGTNIGTCNNNCTGKIYGSGVSAVQLGTSSVSFNCRADTSNNSSSLVFSGTYFYVVWGYA